MRSSSIGATAAAAAGGVVLVCVALLTLTAVGKHRSELASGLDVYGAASLNPEVNFPTTSLGSVGGKKHAAVIVLEWFHEFVFAESMY
jgi:hypothetical protein